MDENFDPNYVQSLIEKGTIVPEGIVITILMKIQEVLYQESSVLELSSPIVVCGDIHGQLDDLLELFRTSERSDGTRETQKYLFMGDYVDRGYHSLNTFLYLVVMKLKYPGQYFLLRGNHESRQVSQMYGFYQECIQNYGHCGIWSLCNETFDLLPMAALIDGDIFSVHGGLSPELPLIEMMALINRQEEIPAAGPLCDLCWSDPDDTVAKWRQNQRGAGYIFGAHEVYNFMTLNKLTLITRAHQLAQDGFRWYFDKRLCTVWSAPNYSYRSNNDASIMKIRFPGQPEQFHLEIFQPSKVRIVPKDLPTANHYFV